MTSDLAQDMAECIFTCNWESIDDLKSYIVNFLNEVESKKYGTSVICWTRYDGTPETLPELGIVTIGVSAMCVVQRVACKYTIVANLYDAGDGDLLWDCGEGDDTDAVEEGDLWTYLPEPPEGME